MAHGDEHEPNSILEPNDETGNQAVAENSMHGGAEGHHNLAPSDDGFVDESKLCILDSACTSCMHSKKWRLAYEKSLPEGLECRPTEQRKVFHFADGSSSESQLTVWEIPVFFRGRRGQVRSAEVEGGTTPLLLSIPAMTALDMVLFVKRRVCEVQKLDIELPMVVTRTKHLAVCIAYDENEVSEKALRQQSVPSIVSERDDLLVYYSEEADLPILSNMRAAQAEWAHASKVVSAPQLGNRGISNSDVKGSLSERRCKELEASSYRVSAQDGRTWSALKREYTLAEQWATKSFQTTVVFEPFGGNFGVTRCAAQFYGWTNSQPLDILDGYDLISPGGRRLFWEVIYNHDPYLILIAFPCKFWSLLSNLNPTVDWEKIRKTLGRETLKLVVDVCIYQHQRGRYYLLENPSGSLAWVYERLLPRLLAEAAAKYATGDQCPFGKKDAVSGRPVRKPTGWMSNNEILLNEICRKCSCPWGSHQPLLGRNELGLRSAQAAAYPEGLCMAICRGIKKSMKLDYSVAMSLHAGIGYFMLEKAYPVMDEPEVSVEAAAQEEMHRPDADGDYWQLLPPDRLVRHHQVPRMRLFIPAAATMPPVPIGTIIPGRRTRIKYLDHNYDVVQEDFIEDDWARDGVKTLSRLWVGKTEFRHQHVFADGVEGDVEDEDFIPLPLTPAPGTPAPMTPVPQQVDNKILYRRRTRTKQLQRGFWTEVTAEGTLALLNNTYHFVQEQGAEDWLVLSAESEVFQEWKSLESASSEVRLILCSLKARRMKKPQPHAGPLEVPLRRSFLLLQDGKALSTDWEDWSQMAPSSQIRPLVGAGRLLYLALYGAPVGEAPLEDVALEDRQDDRFVQKELERDRQWQVLPRELKLAIKRVHVNLGHASTPAMLKALRISRASTVALKACRLFRCADCPRLKEPHLPKPSKLPIADEFNTHIGLDIIQEKDSTGQSWSWLNVLCQGTTYQVCILLGQTHMNPRGSDVVEAFNTGWTSWAGFPEVGVVADRAKYFLSDFAEEVSDHGCRFDTAAKASPWQIGQIERHGGVWKETFRKMAWSQQVQGRGEVQTATSAVNAAKNALSRKSGFSPNQWVLGKDVRLPASLADEDEVGRIGAQALAATPGTRFFRKNQLRVAAREAFVTSANSEALRRAELRQVRPHRGPWKPGMYCFYYDGANKDPGPNHWRGVARVIGSEGTHTIWISHRGLLIAVSPEHLARAFDEEVRQWTILDQERELIDAMPAAGGTGFLDLRKSPLPPELPDLPLGDGEGEADERQLAIEPEAPNQDVDMPQAPQQPEPQELQSDPSDLSAGSLSMARMRLESDRAARRDAQSSDFFARRRREQAAARERRAQEREAHRMNQEEIALREQQAVRAPAGDTFDVDLDDYHQSRPTRQLSPVVETPEAEADEREAKRLRVTTASDEPDEALLAGEKDSSTFMAYLAVESPEFLVNASKSHYQEYAESYMAKGIDEPTFVFGVKRNDYHDKYLNLIDEYSAGAHDEHLLQQAVKKKGRKEIKLHELSNDLKQNFTGPEGSDEREWKAWLSKEAVEVMSLQASLTIAETKPELVVPTRWVRTNKNDGLVGKPFLAKSRLVVQGFKDKALGYYRRDAPTASAIAESVCLAVCAFLGFTLFAKDIKNAYFSGKTVEREIYLSQPRGGLPGLQHGQLLKARKAIYGFAEAARMFWLALREYLVSDGWEESRLEPALFYLREGKKLKGILVTHVDDIEGGVHPSCLESAFKKSSKALEFATNHYRDFIFRGREIKQTPDGHIDVSMRNYALSMKAVKIDRVRRKQLEAELTRPEMETLQSVAGELGWITRQLRCDLAYENGVVQRCKHEACVADLVKLKQFVGMARRGADFRLRYWSDVDLRNAVIVHLADSGHANGTPEHNQLMRYRSVGGYFIIAANPEILDGKEVRCNILCYQSGQTKRVCRSTLAAEASHLAEAVEAGDWLIVLLEEALSGEVDLKNWSKVIEKRPRVYVTDARSVFDYLHRDATSTSTDKRMAIEGALLRETVRRDNAHTRWIDGMQNIANVLTKSNAEKETLKEFLRTGLMSLVQTEKNKEIKEKKREERSRRNLAKRTFKDDQKATEVAERRRQKAAELTAADADTSDDQQPKEK